ncbi:M16 family metallopeptidase [Sphingomonas ginkgonis]|nr:insulinase family protein [Sphingomonas ginkgonis]
MNLRLTASMLAIAGGLLATVPATRAAEAPAWVSAAGLTPDASIRTGVLANGMRYAIRRNTTPAHNASVRLLIDTGSLNETEEQRGLAHFIEHMVFNGSKDVPEGEFVQRLQRHGLRFGADTNATTDFEHTIYKLDLPETDADTVDTALFLLRQVADKALFDAKSLERERGVVLAEERTRAGPQLNQLVNQLDFLYPGQPIGQRLPIGLTQVIQGAPRERLKAFYDAYYRPERATLVIVGDFDVDQIEAKIRQQFGDWKGEGAAGANGSRGTVATRAGDARVFVGTGLSTAVSISWVRPPDLDADSRPERVRNSLSALALQILNRRIERLAALGEKAPLIAGGAGRSQPADIGDTTQLSAITRPGEWQKGLAAIEQEQRRLLTFGVTQAEIDRELGERRAALAASVAGADTRFSSGIADTIIAAVGDKVVTLSPADQLALFDEVARQATPATVLAAVKPLFTGSGPLLYLSSPTPVMGVTGKPPLVRSGASALQAAFVESQAVAVRPTVFAAARPWPYTSFGVPGRVLEQRVLGDTGATAVRFANGVRLIVKPTAFAKDQILVQARLGGGKRALDPAAVNPEWAIEGGAVILGGTGKLSYEQMQQTLAGKIAGASLAVDDDRFVLAGRTTPADLPTQMQLLAANIADPGWRPTGWDRYRGLAPAIQAQLASSPGGVMGRDAQALLHSGDRRWALPSLDQMSVSNISQARALLAPAFAAAPIEVVMVGDVTVTDAIRATRATFGALPRRRGEAQAHGPDPLFPKPGEVTLTHQGRKDQAAALVAWPTVGFYGNSRDARTLNLLAEIIQLRLTQKVREEQGIAYSPSASHAPSEVWDRYGVFSAAIEAPPATLAGFVDTVRGIVTDLRTRPVEADELQRAQKPLLEGVARTRLTNAYWLTNLAGAADDPRVLPKIDSQVAGYRSITPAMLQAAAQTYLDTGRAFVIKAVPAKP